MYQVTSDIYLYHGLSGTCRGAASLVSTISKESHPAYLFGRRSFSEQAVDHYAGHNTPGLPVFEGPKPTRLVGIDAVF